MIKVIFDHQNQLTNSIYSFYFRPTARLRYIAGQFIELYIPHPAADGRGVRRWFTLSSSPTEALLAITTRLDSAQSSSFKSALMGLQPGTKLQMAAPMGDFVLPKDPQIPLLFVAIGVGCTPFRSILKFMQDTSEKRSIKLLHAMASPQEVIFRDVLNVLGNNLYALTTKDLTVQKILEHATPAHYIYLSGPEPVVELLDKQLKESNINPSQIRTDFFHGYPGI